MRTQRILRGLGAVALALLAGRASAQAPAQAPPKAPATPVAAPQQAARPAALVNGEPIPMSEVMAVLSQQPPSTTPLTEMQKREMQQSAVNMLIENALMHQFLKKNAPAAPAAEIEKEIADLKAHLAKDKRSLEDFLKETGQSEAELRSEIAAHLQWKLYATPRMTDAAIKAYYDANKVYFDKVFVRASHVLIRLQPGASAQDKAAAMQKLQAIRLNILANKITFEDAAKTYSDCPSKQNGGDIGPFPYKFAVAEPFAKVAFAMKVGDISDVVETEFGLHIIKVTNRDNGQPSDFTKMQDQVKQIYMQEMYQTVVVEQRRAARVEVFFPAQK
jgi:peptidyl-prolyl cis-trans isomerase C